MTSPREEITPYRQERALFLNEMSLGGAELARKSRFLILRRRLIHLLAVLPLAVEKRMHTRVRKEA